jgi:hypothetical protein
MLFKIPWPQVGASSPVSSDSMETLLLYSHIQLLSVLLFQIRSIIKQDLAIAGCNAKSDGYIHNSESQKYAHYILEKIIPLAQCFVWFPVYKNTDYTRQIELSVVHLNPSFVCQFATYQPMLLCRFNKLSILLVMQNGLSFDSFRGSVKSLDVQIPPAIANRYFRPFNFLKNLPHYQFALMFL